MGPHLDLVGHRTGETHDGVGVLGHVGGLPGGAVVGGFLPPAHPVLRAVGVGADECRGRPPQCHRVDGGGRRQVAHRRGRPVERDGVGGGVAGGVGHYHRDRLGGLRGQHHRRSGRAARGRRPVHRHRRTRVGGGGGHLHPGHIQRRRAPVPECGCVEGGGDRKRVVVLVGQRQGAQRGQGRRLGCHLLADSPGVLCPHLDLVGHRAGETHDGVGVPGHVGGLPGGAVVVGL